MLAGLTVGAHGAIGSTYNYNAPVYRRVIEAFERGDMVAAANQMRLARDSVQVLVEFGGLPAGKAMLGLCGVDCGTVRLPLRTLSRERIEALRTALSHTDWDRIRCA